MLYQSFLCSFIAVPLLILVSCMATLNAVDFTTYDFTFRPNYVTTLATIRLRQVGRGPKVAVPKYEFELQESIMWSV